MKPRTNLLLWAVQSLLAALFLFAGYAKLNMPAEILAKATGLPAIFMQFISVCELLGAVGLIAPGALRIARGLTPLAAAGLAIIMTGATTLTLLQHVYVMALLPFLTGVLAVIVARMRWSWLASSSSGPSSTVSSATGTSARIISQAPAHSPTAR